MPGPFEIGLILLILLFIVGPKKIPDLAKSLGKGLQEFKKAIKEEPKSETPETPTKTQESEPNS